MKRAVFLPLLALPLMACQHQTDKSSASSEGATIMKVSVVTNTVTLDLSKIKVQPVIPGQRFAPTSSALVAFDSETGQLCMTYQWDSEAHSGMNPCSWLDNWHPNAKPH